MGSRNATHEDFAKVGRLMAAGQITAQMMLSTILISTPWRSITNSR